LWKSGFFGSTVIQAVTPAVAVLMSRIIIVKLQYNEKGELIARNFDRRHEQCIAKTAEVEQMFGQRAIIFAEGRLTSSGQIIILRRARDRLW
jgi:hypothetical protein